MRKTLLFCLAAVLFIYVGYTAKTIVDDRNKPQSTEEIEKELFDSYDTILDSGAGFISDNMIFVPYEYVKKFKSEKIDIPCHTSELGWCLFGLSKEGKDLEQIEIPAYVEGKPVVCLMAGAFFRCPNLVSVTVPDTIRCAFKYVFAYCPKLKSITSTGNFFDAVGGVNSPIFEECNISEWNYSNGLDVEFSFAPMAE